MTPTPTIICGNHAYTLQGLEFSKPPTNDSNWTTGNVCQGPNGCYSEGEDVPSRLTISGLTPGSSYSIVIQHDYNDGHGLLGYLSFHNDTPVVVPDVGATGTTIVSIGEVPCGSGNTCKNYNLEFTATAETATMYWDSLLSYDASEWNGASLHFRLVSGICDENVGNKEVPIQVNKIIPVPTPTPTIIPTETPTPTPTDTPTPTPTPTEIITPSPSPTPTCAEDVVTNGGFEIPTVTYPAGWNIFNNSQVLGWAAEWYGGSDNYNGYTRPEPKIEIQAGVNDWTNPFDQYVELDTDWFGPDSPLNGEPASISLYQNVPTFVGNEYTLRYDYSPRPNHNDNHLEVKINDLVVFDSGSIAGGSNVNWQTKTYTFTADNTLTRISFTERGNPDSLGMFLNKVSMECLGNGKSTIKVCKKDSVGTPLPDWRVIIRGEEVDSFDVPSDGTTPNTVPLATGNYAVLASGTYNYGNERMIADAANSYRYVGLPCAGSTDGWVNGDADTCINHYLNVNPSLSGGPTDAGWGTYYNPENKYAKSFSGGDLAFKIWDRCNNSQLEGCYGDNEGSIQINVYNGYVGDTGEDGCVTFENVPYGTYTLEEILQNGWSYTRGDAGEIIIDIPSEEFNLVNDQEGVTPTITPSVTPTETPTPTPTETLTPTPPIYEGNNACPEDTTPVKVGGPYTISSTSPTGVTISDITFDSTKDYLFEATGNYGYGGVPQDNELHRADAGYATKEGTDPADIWDPTNIRGDIGIWSTATYRGVTSLLSDMGTGNVGIVDWGSYTQTHLYNFLYRPASQNVQFLISDWYDSWYNGGGNNNQGGMRDNEGNLAVNVYECQQTPIPATPKLYISKFNNKWPTDQVPGNDVTYTLTLTASGSAITDVVLTDLPPGGFKYRSGSWTVTKNGLPYVIDEPHYASPGKWLVGKMNDGDEIVLTYIADIDNSEELGLYKDLAWAVGDTTVEDGVEPTKILAQSVDSGKTDPGIITDNFVGTKINLLKNDDYATSSVNIVKEETQTGEVLGASTGLPSTGAATLWVILAGILMMLGVALVSFGLALRSRWGKNFLKFVGTSFAMLFLTAFILVGNANAADLSIRLQEPKTPTRNNTFKINFVTLDLSGLDRNITVKCLKKGPSDADFVQFGGDIAITPGGNTSYCNVDSSIINTDGKTYLFQATATAGIETVWALQTVSVDYNTSGPSTPTNYSKDHPSSCQYVIKFKTADDGGKTVKVEIYRSENTSFGIDSSNRVGTVIIGSNQDGSYTDNVPDCGKTYYYAIRAYDTAGNGSGVIGDSVVTIISTTTTTTTSTTTTEGGALPVEGAALSQSEITGEVANPEEGQALGESTESAQAEKVVPTEEVVKANILGVAVKKENRKYIYLSLGGIVALAVAYAIIAKKKKDTTPPPQI